ncbi:hypothetical protein JOF28_002621 [Leucobacter exalbidus]|uniref:Uncharacterized protein n=1 Tax=Leucobacter exalbidus TaxID=662960 RepID=A0A940T515_9MICO|nr:hypothetical protein [Leucobacter exalbidus]MBP1327389.1 hypothetical protein [Leucobacter exalbidus]
MFSLSSAPRRHRAARFGIPAVLTAAAMLLTGCSTSDAAPSPEDLGPLSKYLSAMYDEEEYTQEKFEAEQGNIEELVAECMTEEGFEYLPNVQSGNFYSPSEDGEDTGPDWGSQEFAENYGYGIIDYPGMEESNQQAEEYNDPNEEYTSSLSEKQLTAYYNALHGPGPNDEEMLAMEEGDGSYAYNWETAGCYGAAQHEAQGESGSSQDAYEDPEFAELFASMQDVWSVLYDENSDNEVVAKLNSEWQECMAEAGFTEYPSPNAVTNALYEEQNELYNSTSEDGEYQEPSKEARDEFKQREITIATADFACKKDLKYDAKIMTEQFELEQAFVDANKPALDALISKYSPKNDKK